MSKKPLPGEVQSTVVPESLVELLPCFPLEAAGTPDQVRRLHPTLQATYGSQYLRKCEARAVGVARSQAVLAAHGVAWRPATTFACDFDGSFAPKWAGRTT